MDTDAILEWLIDHTTELVLVIGGIVAILVVYSYLKDKDSTKYKFLMFLGLLAGAAMIYVAAVGWNGLNLATTIIVAIGGFALLIRPFREVHFAALLALFIMVIAYILLGTLVGAELFGFDITFLSEGWPRIILSVVAGSIVYMITNFGEEIIKVFGKILNWWPLLFLLGIICVAEGVSIYMGYGSLYDVYLKYASQTEGIIFGM
jgi:hypothetical protein